ncbi:MAG: aminodeoxychorismate lyase [Crocinitomicaceae bacterium]|nr:aminodeoxychorismate lyase [Crocinitomicaceae bacterium]|tara:strand:- start:13640 stop:14695 length:1056 start_codon:yes stop_codon:yes gene_type:complete
MKFSFFKKVIIAIVVVILAGAGITAWHYYSLIFVKENVQVKNPDNKYFYIHTGWTFEDVKQSLYEKNYILNQSSFEWVAELKKYKYNVKPGRFLVKEGMSNNDLINLLRLSGNQTPVQFTFSYDKVHSLEDLAGLAAKKIEPDSTTLANYIKNPEMMAHYGFNERTILAMFIPNTYELYWNTGAEEFYNRMAKEFKSFWTPERLSKAKELDMSQSEVVTLASIVQGETIKKDEMPKVAGLYINRLKKEIALQSDPTVKFALGEPTRNRIYYKHLQVESPYNTYLNKGLPPGPIGVPSIAAIDAVLNYTKHNYIFMCARPDFSGYHNFAITNRQHEINSAKYHRFLNQQNIR